MSTARAHLVDASIYIFRAYFSLPDNWHTPQGWPLNAVYGYCSFLLEWLGSTAVTDCAVAFDESLGSCFRNDLYPGYKARRELPDEALAFQLDSCRQLTERLGLPCFSGSRYEADDYIATLARLYREQGLGVTVLTRDKDLGQLIAQPLDRWWDYSAGVQLDEQGFTDKHGVRPAQFADYLALTGDAIDDIPGVPGIGHKTAGALLQHFTSLEQLGARLSEVGVLPIRGAARVQARLQQHWQQVLLSRQLTGLAEDVPDVELPATYQLRRQHLDEVRDYLGTLGLGGPLLRRLDTLEQAL